MNRSHAPSRLRRAVGLLAILTLALLTPLAGALPASAASTGSITSLTAGPDPTAVGGGSGSLSIGWSFPDTAINGDTVTVDVPQQFSLTSINPQAIKDVNGNILAQLSYNNAAHTLTITRDAPAGVTGIDSGATPVQPAFTLTDPALTDGTTVTYTWKASQGGPFTTPFTARADDSTAPSWYVPYKSGTFSYDAQGNPIITWGFHTRTSGSTDYPAGSLRLSDTLSPGQELVCSSLQPGTVRSWDQSYPVNDPGHSDAWYAWSVFGADQATATPLPHCTSAGLDDILQTRIPAETTGSGPLTGAPKVYALYSQSYITRITDLTSNSWTNTVTLSAINGGPEPGSLSQTVSFPGNAKGNRLLTVTKKVTGPQAPSGASFAINVKCTAGDGTAIDTTLHLAANESAPVYPATGALCTVTEPDSQGGEATVANTSTVGGTAAAANDPLAITNALQDTFSATVTNNFPAPANGDLVIAKQVEGDAGQLPAGTTFGLAWACTLNDKPSASGQVDLAAGQTRTVQAPQGSLCSVSEPQVPAGATAKSSDPVTIPASGAAPTLTVTNSYAQGTVDVKKVVVDPDAVAPSGNYAIEVSCTLDGKALTGSPFDAQVEAGASVSLSVLAGSTCSASEPDNRGAASTSVNDPVTVSAAGAAQELVVTNRFEKAPVTTPPTTPTTTPPPTNTTTPPPTNTTTPPPTTSTTPPPATTSTSTTPAPTAGTTTPGPSSSAIVPPPTHPTLPPTLPETGAPQAVLGLGVVAILLISGGVLALGTRRRH